MATRECMRIEIQRENKRKGSERMRDLQAETLKRVGQKSVVPEGVHKK